MDCEMTLAAVKCVASSQSDGRTTTTPYCQYQIGLSCGYTRDRDTRDICRERERTGEVEGEYPILYTEHYLRDIFGCRKERKSESS
jgi:hypothetical protein